MARALIVGCGCRGRELGARLLQEGWAVRGSSRDSSRLSLVRDAGLDGVLADPDQPGTILDHVGDVGIVVWLLGSASGEPDALAAIHGTRLESLLEKLVDTPVRGFVYEAVGSVDLGALATGRKIVAAAGERWRIPVAFLDAGALDGMGWLDGAVRAVLGLAGQEPRNKISGGSENARWR